MPTGVYVRKPQHNDSISKSLKGIPKSEEHRKNLSLARKGKPLTYTVWNKGKKIPVTPKQKEHLIRLHKKMKGRIKSELERKHMSDAQKGRTLSPERRKQISEQQKGKKLTEEHKQKIRNSAPRGKKHKFYGISPTYSHRCNLIESHIGGFWYGNVRYPDRKVYCELWNSDLWRRIDAFWEYKSCLSEKTKIDNEGKTLHRHHVYWQKKACCGWDEDTRGYYAIINIGTPKKPNIYKHYIKGDPNKFVLLTNSEHGTVSKDKLKWIKIFEDIIESKGGKCYYTKEEMKKYRNI